jgi:hypothetical protein
MHCYLRYLLVAGGMLLATTATMAQRRNVRDVVVVPEAQVELALKGSDYVLVGFNLVTSPDGGSTFAAGQLRLGYEHFLNEQWSIGATLRVLGGDNYSYGDFLGLDGNITPGVLVRHSGKIGAFNFGQRLGVEYAATFDVLGSDNENRALTRLRLDVDRVFPLGEKLAVRPRLAYEPVTYLRLQRDENDIKERVIDFGNLRAEVGVRLSPHVDFTPWVASQTYYINSLPQYDALGQQTGGGRTNLVTPTLGIDLRLTLFTSSPTAERYQLPTQH